MIIPKINQNMLNRNYLIISQDNTTNLRKHHYRKYYSLMYNKKGNIIFKSYDAMQISDGLIDSISPMYLFNKHQLELIKRSYKFMFGSHDLAIISIHDFLNNTFVERNQKNVIIKMDSNFKHHTGNYEYLTDCLHQGLAFKTGRCEDIVYDQSCFTNYQFSLVKDILSAKHINFIRMPLDTLISLTRENNI